MDSREISMMRHRKDIIDLCIRLELPLTARSTSIQIFDRIADEMVRDDVEMNDMIYATVILASKCEEIHGEINTIMKKLPGCNKENIFNYENRMFEVLNYKFHFPSLHLRMYGVIVILQEKELIKVNGSIDLRDTSPGSTHYEGVDNIVIDNNGEWIIPCVDRWWRSSVQVLDNVLLLNKTGYKEIELIYASLQLPCNLFNSLGFEFNEGHVMRLRSVCKKNYPSEIEDSICV